VAHLSEGILRRKFDDEDALTVADARHYSACAECQARYAALADDARAVAGVLAVPDLKVDVASAFKRVRTAPAAQPRFGIRLPIVRTSRPVMGVLAAAVVILALVVTGVAQDAITFFHPETVQPVQVSVADLQSLSGLGDYGTFTWTKKPTPQLVTSADEAAAVSKLHVPVAGNLPSSVSTTITYAAMSGAVGVFTFDAAKAAAAAAKAGKPLPTMPPGMDHSTLTVTLGGAVVEVFGKLNAGAASDATQLNLPQLVIGVSATPLVTSSSVTPTVLEDYLLNQPGVSPQLAAAIRAIKNPSTTLAIPIPIQYATSAPATVQGFDGVALGDNTGLGAAVIWINNQSNLVYGVAGTLNHDQILEIANNLK
jgi:hypothetical protein